MAPVPDLLVDAMLQQLERRMPSLMAEYPGIGSFWTVFAALAEVIYEGAEPANHLQISEEVTAIIVRHDVPYPFIIFQY